MFDVILLGKALIHLEISTHTLGTFVNLEVNTLDVMEQ